VEHLTDIGGQLVELLLGFLEFRDVALGDHAAGDPAPGVVQKAGVHFVVAYIAALVTGFHFGYGFPALLLLVEQALIEDVEVIGRGVKAANILADQLFRRRSEVLGVAVVAVKQLVLAALVDADAVQPDGPKVLRDRRKMYKLRKKIVGCPFRAARGFFSRRLEGKRRCVYR